MSPSELSEFRARCLAAKVHGRKVAKSADYAKMLEAEGGEVELAKGMAKHSPAHLIALADNVAKVRVGGGKPTPKAPKVEEPVAQVETPTPAVETVETVVDKMAAVTTEDENTAADEGDKADEVSKVVPEPESSDDESKKPAPKKKPRSKKKDDSKDAE